MAEADGGTLRPSPGAFLFALGYHAGGGPIKMELKKSELGERAVLHHRDFGPCFGYDVCVLGDSNSNTNSHTFVVRRFTMALATLNPN